jgi:hypothetical protein
MNYVGEESIKNNADLRQRVLKIDSDKEHVQMICKQEIEALMRMAADVTNMTHQCKLQGRPTICKTPTQMRKSLCENQSVGIVKQLHWMFHQLPWETHQSITLKEKTHQDLVVDKVMEDMNITFMKEEDDDKNPKQRNCIQQMYTKVLNMKKQDLMKKGGGNTSDIQAFLKRPVTLANQISNNKYSRSKTVFYWSGKNEDGGSVDNEVMQLCDLYCGCIPSKL